MRGMTRCFYHPEIETETKCELCGKAICPECHNWHEGKLLCAKCDARVKADGFERVREQMADTDKPYWWGLVLPGLAQLLKGEVYKGSFFLVYFIGAIAANNGFFVVLAYALSIWDFFSPMVHEESKWQSRFDFRIFVGVMLMAVGIIAVTINLTNTPAMTRQAAAILMSLLTIAFGLFVTWDKLGERTKEAGNDG
jgi:hypothetical protein